MKSSMMSDTTNSATNCPLAIFVSGQKRTVVRGYACGWTGGHCRPCKQCGDRVTESVKEPQDNE